MSDNPSPSSDFNAWAARAVIFADAFEAAHAAGAVTVCWDYALAAVRSAKQAVGDQWDEPKGATRRGAW